MSTHNICFCKEIKKKYLPDTHSYLDFICAIYSILLSYSFLVYFQPLQLQLVFQASSEHHSLQSLAVNGQDG